MKKLMFLWLLVINTFISCGGGGGNDPVIPPDPDPVEIIPSNLVLNITVVGTDAANPNGDGSGTIQCSASATNASSYGFRFGNGTEETSTSGNIEHTYSTRGTNTYSVTVFAYSSTNNSISTSMDVTVYVNDNLQLVWSDEFDVDGAPNTNNWTYDIGTGSNGWGNNESQYYTDRSQNVSVSNGTLKITALKENYQGSAYTSTRLKTQGKYQFTYGRVEVKAKVPAGGGTWPAIWMLGSNITSVGWPACGEVDIMEHVGNDQGTIHGSIHTPSSSGNTVNTGTKYVADATSNFHVYAVNWDADKIEFLIDDVVYYTYSPATKDANTWPFDANQFIILNVAMGGNFGGTIDPNFSSATMEVDYVRVYQY